MTFSQHSKRSVPVARGRLRALPQAGRRWALAAFGAAALAASGPAALAQSAAEKGLAIAREAERRAQGWGDSTAIAQMVLRDREGNVSARQLELRALEARGEGSGDGRSLLIFRSPPDVSGTALLTHSFKNREDDQWIYLPEIARVKRISSSSKSGSFMGSEFSYEDMRDAQIEKFTFTWIAEEACGEARCFVLERRPKDDDSMYSRQLAWIEAERYITVRVDFFNRRNDKVKSLTLSDYRQYSGKFWRPHMLRMVNFQTGKSTDLIWQSYRFGQNLNPRDFEQSSLAWLR